MKTFIKDRQHEVLKEQPLLDSKGCVGEPGYARRLVWKYDRNKIQASRLRIKEWDYYLVYNDHFGVAFTLADLGYAGMLSASWLDFDKEEEQTQTTLTAFPMGRFHLGSHSYRSQAEVQTGRAHIKYSVMDGRRRIQCKFRRFSGEDTLSAEIWLKQDPALESMCIATPWKEDPKAFYYNQKINCMPASGIVRLGSKEYRFSSSTAMGVLDWGRGVWTYDNTWYWGTGSGWIGGKPFGMNIGYGFSDRSSATENALIYDGKLHKLEEVDMHIPKGPDNASLYMENWEITSSDGRLEGIFRPILDRKARMDLKLIVTDQHQVFGRLTGEAVLDDGTTLELRDFLCAIEVVHNRY